MNLTKSHKLMIKSPYFHISNGSCISKKCPHQPWGVPAPPCGRGANLWILQNGIQASHGCDESSMPVTAKTGQLGNKFESRKKGAYCMENMAAFVS